jgi:hypothetical protein
MSPYRSLAPDQRAVLELLLRQGRGYDELSELLGIPEDAVRSRAHAALATLAPDRPAPVGEDGAVADWILGQQDGGEADGTRAALARTPAWRAWAAEVTAGLADLDGADLPEVPEAEEDAPPAAAPPKKPAAAKPERRPRPVRDSAAAAPAGKPAPKPDPAPAATPEPATAPAGGLPLRSSKLGGAIVLGLLAVIVALVLILVVFGGDDEGEPQADATPTPTATASATPEVVREIVLQGQGNRAQGLMRVFRREQDGNLIFALAADNVPPNRSNEVYAVWFTREGGTPRNLGFAQTPVGEEGVFTTGGPQEGQEAEFARWLTDYDNVIVARASADSAEANRPGRVVLRGRLPGGEN